ncbi:MAG TPA: cupredoxin domain-containing protein [Dehalococcoidia bacterium]|nr:cupredoxin domain-containing protein [Dehalococcoidia bacterium]
MKFLRIFGLMLAATLAVAFMAACGDDEGDGGGDEATTGAAASPTDGNGGGGGEVNLELAAENTAYAEQELSAPAGAAVKLEFDNDDEGLQHNFSLYESEESEDPLFEGEIITGVSSITYEFTAPEEPGTYHYHCEIHPTAMTGEFIVE